MRSAGADSRDGSVVRGHGRAMHAPDDLSEYYAELLEGSYECVDRIVLNAYYRLGQMGGGVRLWWRRLHGGSDARLTTRGLREMAGDFARRVRAYCAKQQIVFLETEAGERKHELAEEYLRTTRRKRGLFLVICAKAPAPLWEVHRHEEGGHITDIRHGARWQHVKHYYFHLLDPQWGHVTVRMCGHPPFGAQVILNGHERVYPETRFDDVISQGGAPSPPLIARGLRPNFGAAEAAPSETDWLRSEFGAAPSLDVAGVADPGEAGSECRPNPVRRPRRVQGSGLSRAATSSVAARAYGCAGAGPTRTRADRCSRRAGNPGRG